MADGDEVSKRKRLATTINHMLSDNHEVFIITSNTSGENEDDNISEEVCSALEITGCTVRVVTTGRGWFSSIRSALWVARHSTVSILVLVDTHPVALAILRCLAAPRLAYIQRTSHLHELPVLKCFYQVLLRFADDVIVLSRASADLYQSMFCNCKVPKILYPCIDIGSMEVDETVSIQRFIPNIAKYTHIFFTYGNYKPKTNFDLVIDAFEIFYSKIHKRHRGEKIRLIIAGNLNQKDQIENNYINYLKSRLEGKKFAKDIIILRKLNTRCKKTLLAYSVCAVFGYSSTRSFLEALFVGRPVLSIKSNIAKELIPRRVGFRLNPSAKDFAQALLFLHGDTQLAEKMGHNAKVYYAQNFSFGKFAQKIRSFVKGNAFQCQSCLEFFTINKFKQSTSEFHSCSNCSHE